MTTKEKIQLIEGLITHYKELSRNFDKINEIFDGFDGPLYNSVWAAFDGYTHSVSKLIGDEFDYINWFIFDNKCGRGGMVCKFQGKSYKIKTVKDLVKFMELEGENNKD